MLYICRYLWRHCSKYCGNILQFVICVSNKWENDDFKLSFEYNEYAEHF